ncbi:hypothetical protein [Agromyces ramosus]|uniref:PH (Pleckstrin Homology) domain-containing protein n=1 Tax=Agromyces ramosus TaxID=33879 RepID=A0ABU0R7W8_9MICO|nr:hypothetical protein [Agromyces ramosus]MDQ0894181.1 hypothetical protein [Agromyces ramosus]
MDPATAIVTIPAWNPWPLAFPAMVLTVGIVLLIDGGQRGADRVREAGYVAFVFAALTGLAMTWTLSGIWDTQQRAAVFAELGYESPTFEGSLGISGGELQPLSFTAVRDGERVRGVLRHLGGDEWEIREIQR